MMRSMAMPRREPPHREFGEIEEAVRTGERHAIVGPDRLGQATLLEELLEGSDGKVLAGRFKGFAEQEKARGMVGDSQRKAVSAFGLPRCAASDQDVAVHPPRRPWARRPLSMGCRGERRNNDVT